nr:trihelix transcription factor ASIL2 [Ipomoea batatas]
MRMEKRKIEMMRDTGRYRIEMEKKRLDMILETQRKIADSVRFHLCFVLLFSISGVGVQTSRISKFESFMLILATWGVLCAYNADLKTPLCIDSQLKFAIQVEIGVVTLGTDYCCYLGTVRLKLELSH